MSARPAEAVRGDWDGTEARDLASVRAELDELRRQVRAAYVYVLEHRNRWAPGVTAEDRVRAVAYQTCASRLLRILDTQRAAEPDPAPAAPAPPATELPVPPTTAYPATDPDYREPRPLGWLFRQGSGSRG